MAKQYSVYHLVDPETKAVRYVGKSTAPKARYKTHIEESKERQNTEKKACIYALMRSGKAPVLVIVAAYPSEEQARQRESHECHLHKATITNIHDPAKGAKDLRKVKPKA
jgi:hypothetical protein